MSLWSVFCQTLRSVGILGRLPKSTDDHGTALMKLLASYGVEIERDGEWILFDQGRQRARVGLVPNRNAALGAGLELQFQFEFSQKSTFSAAVPGFGSTFAESIPDAWQTFARGILPAVMSAFLGCDSRSVKQEEWEIGGRRWSVTQGRLAIFPEVVFESSWTRRLNPQFRRILETTPLTAGIHTIHLFYRSTAGQTTEFSGVWVDGQPHPQLNEALKTIDYPQRRTPYRVSQFFVLMPIGPPPVR